MNRFRLVVYMWVCVCGFTEGQGSATITLKTHFSVEERTDSNVATPRSILQQLRKDPTVSNCIVRNEVGDKNLSRWFKASKLHLNNLHRTDYLIMPLYPCLLGANIDPIWVFIRNRDGYERVLSVGTHDFEILVSTTKGYRDLKLTSATANQIITSIYKFNGKNYDLAKNEVSLIP